MYKIYKKHRRIIIPVLLSLIFGIGVTSLGSTSTGMTLYAADATRITLNPSSFTLIVGETTQLTASYTPADATVSLSWYSSDSSIAEVSDDGVVKAISQGIAVIYAQGENGVTGMATVNVVDNSVVSVTITPDNLILELDQTGQLTAQLTPANAESKISWSSMDTSIATVNEEGRVTAVGKGTTFIYATSDNGVKGVAVVKVINSKEILSIKVVPENVEMVAGGEAQLEVEYQPSTANPEINWISIDPSIAEVNEDGLVRAVSPGATVIYAATENGMTGFASVNVLSNEVSSIVIEPDDVTLSLDETIELTALVEPEGVEAVLTWTSTDTSVATVDNQGVVKALEPGFTFIYATSENGVTGLAVVKVTDPDSGGDNPGQGYGEDGVYISAIRIREGDLLGLFADRPVGYENNDWTYDWYLDGELEAEGKYVLITAGQDSDWQGTVKEITPESYQVEIFNTIGDEITHDLPQVSVYARPQTPEELLRKGDGESGSFIAMSRYTDSELTNMGYSFVFGYTDGAGVNHVLSNSELRYCHTTKDIYNNSTYRFWVYTSWVYPDGAVITSGLRYLDGKVDENFNRSDYNLTRTTGIESLEGEREINIYTLDGHSAGQKLDVLAPGIYIIRERQGNHISTRKIIKR
ncbi:MAG: Ig-like domain-containing protein [Muribaculaceae bacterium]|nr:Ig-like domain-containing protein [Muribaculaceae bacterium]